MKPHIWRPGDKFRVLRPLWVKRVGYPLVWYELMPEVEEDLKVGQAWDVLNGVPPRAAPQIEPAAALFFIDLSDSPTAGVPRYFLQAAAKALVESRAFGGNERRIIYTEELARYRRDAGTIHVVRRKRVVKTGTRFARTGGVYCGSDGPEDWYEPAGLADMKTHILLTSGGGGGGGGEIEAANVELIDKNQ